MGTHHDVKFLDNARSLHGLVGHGNVEKIQFPTLRQFGTIP